MITLAKGEMPRDLCTKLEKNMSFVRINKFRANLFQLMKPTLNVAV
jgi:hypothetical protein